MDEEAKRKAEEEAARLASGSAASALLNAALGGGESAPSARLTQLKLELSEEADLAELEEIKLKHALKSRKRKIIQKALDEGIDDATLAEHLASLDIGGSQKTSDPPPAAAVTNGAAAIAASPIV